MGVGLSCTNGETCGFRDLAEAKVKSILQGDYRRLRARQLGKARAELAPCLGGHCSCGGIAVERRTIVGDERLGATREPCLGEVFARVHDQAVEPGRELRVAAELPESHDEFCQSVLAGIARILWIAEQMQSDSLDPPLVARTQHLKRGAIAILRASHENWVGETLEIESGGVGRVM